MLAALDGRELRADEARELHARTEGWPAAVYLAARRAHRTSGTRMPAPRRRLRARHRHRRLPRRGAPRPRHAPRPHLPAADRDPRPHVARPVRRRRRRARARTGSSATWPRPTSWSCRWTRRAAGSATTPCCASTSSPSSSATAAPRRRSIAARPRGSPRAACPSSPSTTCSRRAIRRGRGPGLRRRSRGCSARAARRPFARWLQRLDDASLRRQPFLAVHGRLDAHDPGPPRGGRAPRRRHRRRRVRRRSPAWRRSLRGGPGLGPGPAWPATAWTPRPDVRERRRREHPVQRLATADRWRCWGRSSPSQGDPTQGEAILAECRERRPGPGRQPGPPVRGLVARAERDRARRLDDRRRPVAAHGEAATRMQLRPGLDRRRPLGRRGEGRRAPRRARRGPPPDGHVRSRPGRARRGHVLDQRPLPPRGRAG